jgi:hypothetical protein
MTDQPMTRDELIEKAAQVICDAFEVYAPVPAVLRTEAPNIARALAEESLLANPEQRDTAAVLARVRAALGTPDGRAVSVHAAEVRAERDNLIAVRDELARQRDDHRAEREALQARIDAALARLKEADELSAEWPPSLKDWTAFNSKLIHVRDALQGDQPTEPPPCVCKPDCCIGEGDPPNRCEHCATIDGELPCPIADAEPDVTPPNPSSRTEGVDQ